MERIILPRQKELSVIELYVYDDILSNSTLEKLVREKLTLVPKQDQDVESIIKESYLLLESFVIKSDVIIYKDADGKEQLKL
jgi:hypothetical protein